MPTLLAVVLSLVACKSDPPPVEGRAFPEGFRFGSATAGFQVDMGCPTWSDAQCVDTASDWYAWVNDPGVVGDASLFVTGEDVRSGPGMWELFEQDVAQMAADGHTTYRMSIEWSRVFPTEVPDSAATVDDLVPLANSAAVQRYHEMFAALEAHGIEPMVTINHYTLPLWLHDGVGCHVDVESCTARGWLDGPRMAHHGRLYAGFLGREFGDEVDRWVTLNEPYATTLSGYLLPGEDRSSPPGLTFDVEGTKTVVLSQIEGHAAMYDGLVAEDATAEVGIVMNMTALAPNAPDVALDLQGVEHMDYLYHQLYLDALTVGAWDSDLDGVPESTRDDLANRLDFIGINYYNRVTVRGLSVPIVSTVPTFDFFPEFSWEPYPQGLAEVVARAAVYGLPLDVTENGTPFVDDRGVEVLEGHLGALLDSIDAGAPVRSYHYWSWVDNYEWNHGFDLAFGLYALDPATKAREERPVGARYREIATSGRL